MQNPSPIKPPLPPVIPDSHSEKLVKEEQKNSSLLRCPYCQATFTLTWNRYFKASTGKHVCPCCDKKFRVKRAPLSYIPQGFIGIVCGLFVSWGLTKVIGAGFASAVSWLVTAIVVSTVIDKVLEPRLGKVIKVDEAAND